MFRICTLLVLLLPVVAQAAPQGTVKVIDGDTIVVAGQNVRLHGIDAPETDQTCTTEQGAIWPCGAWVTDQVRDRFEGAHAVCSGHRKDRYGRLLATCNVDGQDMGQQIVSAGLAMAYRRYSTAYVLDEKGAAVNDRGLHASRVQSPWVYRQTRAKGRVPPDLSCAIKGNVSAKGELIFHSPGQVDYNRTGINPAKGERWFCSAAEARKAGWRAAKR